MARTNSKSDTRLAQPDSRPVRYKLLSANGKTCGFYDTALEAASAAGAFWPGEGRDEYRDGVGWDIEVVRPKKS